MLLLRACWWGLRSCATCELRCWCCARQMRPLHDGSFVTYAMLRQKNTKHTSEGPAQVSGVGLVATACHIFLKLQDSVASHRAVISCIIARVLIGSLRSLAQAVPGSASGGEGCSSQRGPQARLSQGAPPNAFCACLTEWCRGLAVVHTAQGASADGSCRSGMPALYACTFSLSIAAHVHCWIAGQLSVYTHSWLDSHGVGGVSFLCGLQGCGCLCEQWPCGGITHPISPCMTSCTC